MGYNEGLAVGLAVGLPCFIVLVGVYFFYRRNRRLQKKEDQEGNDIDVEMGENGLFKEFGEALHKSAGPTRPATHAELHSEAADAKGLLSADSLLNSTSSRTQSLPEHRKHPFRKGSVAESQHSGPGPLSPARPQVSPNGKVNLAYAFYDTVIPIMAPGTQLDVNLAQPPSLAAGANGEKNSAESSRGSLIASNSLSKSLETLAKQLQNPLFFEKVPSRASTTLIKSHPLPPRMPQGSTRSSSTVDLASLYGGINDHFVNERSHSVSHPQSHLHHEQQQEHPYRKRVMAHADSEEETVADDSYLDSTSATTRDSREQDLSFR